MREWDTFSPRFGASTFQWQRPIPTRKDKEADSRRSKTGGRRWAEVIILGCAGMAGYAPEIESKLNIKVIDPQPWHSKWQRRWSSWD